VASTFLVLATVLVSWPLVLWVAPRNWAGAWDPAVLPWWPGESRVGRADAAHRRPNCSKGPYLAPDAPTGAGGSRSRHQHVGRIYFCAQRSLDHSQGGQLQASADVVLQPAANRATGCSPESGRARLHPQGAGEFRGCRSAAHRVPAAEQPFPFRPWHRRPHRGLRESSTGTEPSARRRGDLQTIKTPVGPGGLKIEAVGPLQSPAGGHPGALRRCCGPASSTSKIALHPQHRAKGLLPPGRLPAARAWPPPYSCRQAGPIENPAVPAGPVRGPQPGAAPGRAGGLDQQGAGAAEADRPRGTRPSSR